MDTLDSRRILTRVAFGVAAGFVLYTGGADRRKNLPRLVEAYAGLDAKLRAGMQLVFAGHMPAPHVDELKRLAASLGLAERDLVFTGYVSDEQLVALYNECSLFAFPSWHEGFGLPVLEAMACGAAVIASDASSILEIATEPTALFDPMDVDSLRARMAHFLSIRKRTSACVTIHWSGRRRSRGTRWPRSSSMRASTWLGWGWSAPRPRQRSTSRQPVWARSPMPRGPIY